MTPEMLSGQTKAHLIQYDDRHFMHKATHRAFNALQADAKSAGFNLQLVSSFRSFEAQLAIWNNKFTGKRAILDAQSQILDPETLSANDKIKAILRWTALPGASRHHWGSDLDLYDPDLQPTNSPLQLIPQEYQLGGSQAPFAQWLQGHLHQHGFFLPYHTERGGVCPEPWHISHALVSIPALQSMKVPQLTRLLNLSKLAGKSDVLAQLDWINDHYIQNIDRPMVLSK